MNGPKPKIVLVKTALGTTVAAAAALAVSITAAGLTLGLLTVQPLLQAETLRLAAAVGGGGGGDGAQEEAPVGSKICQGLDRIDGGSFEAALQNPDGSYLMAGWARQPGRGDSDIYLVRGYPPNSALGEAVEGCEEWARFFGEESDDLGSALASSVDRDGNPDGYVLTGAWRPSGAEYTAAFLLKTDEEGNLDAAWPENPMIFSSPDGPRVGYSVVQTFDPRGQPTGYILAGRQQSLNPGDGLWASDALIIKTDLQGNDDWTWPEFPQFDTGHTAFSISQTFSTRYTPRQATGYVVTGSAKRSAENTDLLLLLLDLAGNLDAAWSPNPKTFDWSGNDAGKAVRQTFDGAGQPTGLVVAGQTRGAILDAVLLKTDARGNLDPAWPVNPRRFGAEDIDFADDVQQTFDDRGQPTGYILAGETHSPSLLVTQRDAAMYIIRAGPDGQERWHVTPTAGTVYASAHAVQPIAGSAYAYLTVGQTQSLTPGAGNDVIAILLPPGRMVGPTAPEFRRGDADANGHVNLTDAIFTLNGLFLGGLVPQCQDAADADDSGAINLTDAVFTLNYLFLGSGLPPPPPGPLTIGADQTDDPLGCAQY